MHAEHPPPHRLRLLVLRLPQALAVTLRAPPALRAVAARRRRLLVPQAAPRRMGALAVRRRRGRRDRHRPPLCARLRARVSVAPLAARSGEASAPRACGGRVVRPLRARTLRALPCAGVARVERARGARASAPWRIRRALLLLHPEPLRQMSRPSARCVESACEQGPPHPFLPYVAPHFSHISHFNLFFFQGVYSRREAARRLSSLGGKCTPASAAAPQRVACARAPGEGAAPPRVQLGAAAPAAQCGGRRRATRRRRRKAQPRRRTRARLRWLAAKGARSATRRRDERVCTGLAWARTLAGRAARFVEGGSIGA